jgi:hypothetical protein
VEDLQRIDAANRGIASAFAVLLALAGCGSESVPVACKSGPAAIERALRRAPGDVRLDGRRLSDCFAPEGDSGDLQALGVSFLPAAQHLADRRALVRLGFLIGAVHRGAARAPVYEELERRLRQELARVDARSAAYRRGERAGRAHG